MHDILQFLSVPANQDFVETILGGAAAVIFFIAIWYSITKG